MKCEDGGGIFSFSEVDSCSCCLKLPHREREGETDAATLDWKITHAHVDLASLLIMTLMIHCCFNSCFICVFVYNQRHKEQKKKKRLALFDVSTCVLLTHEH